MCVFCEILSGNRRELPWTGNEPVDEWTELHKWREAHARAYADFAGDLRAMRHSGMKPDPTVHPGLSDKSMGGGINSHVSTTMPCNTGVSDRPVWSDNGAKRSDGQTT